MTCVDFARLVDAYVDGEIARDAVSPMEAHLAECAACRRVLEGRLALQQLVRAVPYYTAPSTLRTMVASGAGASGRDGLRRVPRFRVRAQFLAAAAVVALAISGGVVGVGALRVHRSNIAMAAIETELVDAHVAALKSGSLYDVRSSDQHTVKPWFLGKIDFAPPVDDLSASGFPLEGGRLGHVNGRDAAVLVYQRRLHPITVFITPARTGDRAASASIRGFEVRHWVAGAMSFWAVSDLNGGELEEFVRMMQTRR